MWTHMWECLWYRDHCTCMSMCVHVCGYMYSTCMSQTCHMSMHVPDMSFHMHGTGHMNIQDMPLHMHVHACTRHVNPNNPTLHEQETNTWTRNKHEKEVHLIDYCNLTIITLSYVPWPCQASNKLLLNVLWHHLMLYYIIITNYLTSLYPGSWGLRTDAGTFKELPMHSMVQLIRDYNNTLIGSWVTSLHPGIQRINWMDNRNGH